MINLSKKRVLILTNGCPRRLLDSERLKTYFELNNHLIVNNPEDSDVIFCNTCGFNNESANVSLTAIEKLKKYNKRLIVLGCLPKINAKKLKEIFDGEIITNIELSKIDQLFPKNLIKWKDVPDGNKPYFLIPEKQLSIKGKLKKIIKGQPKTSQESNTGDEYQNFFIRIADGCLWNCSYCAIKNAVGTLRSKPIDVCVKEMKKGLNEGYKEFTLEADDSGAFGIDNKVTIVDLLKSIVKVKGDYLIDIRSMNPFWVVKYFKDLKSICDSGKIRQIQVPIQSGSPKILKVMRRPTDMNKLKKILKEIKKTGVKLGTDIIIGFPGETKNDLKLTLNFIKDINFDSVYLLPYSRLKNTDAYKMKQVPLKEIESRMLYLKKELENNNILVLDNYKWDLSTYLSRI